VAQRIGCTTSAVEVLRPSGCSSYDPPVDARDLTVSPAYGNLYYNYADRMASNHLDGDEPTGRSVRNCVGSPPPDKLDKHFWNGTFGGDNLVIDDGRVDVNEDTQVNVRTHLISCDWYLHYRNFTVENKESFRF